MSKKTEQSFELDTRQHIKPEYYTELNEEIKKKYNAYVGPDDTLNKISLADRCERIAKILAFWQIESNVINPKCSSDNDIARNYITSKAKVEIRKLICAFPEKIQELIHKRALEFVSDHNNGVDKMRKRLEIIWNLPKNIVKMQLSKVVQR